MVKPGGASNAGRASDHFAQDCIMAAADLTAARLRELLHYDPLTGLFTWLVKPNRRIRVGDVAGAKNPDDYIIIGLSGRSYLAHRLAWLYVTGFFPPCQIDHHDTNPSNNRWKNLRPATNAQNQQNMRKAQSNNKCGFLGVSQSGDRWRAVIHIDRKSLFIGYYDTPELASEAYLAAKEKHHPFQTITVKH